MKISNIEKIIFPLIVVVLLLTNIYFWYSMRNSQKDLENSIAYVEGLEKLTGISRLGSTHEHADLKIYVDSIPVDLSQQKYQLKSKFIHVEDGDGDVIHKHAKGVTLGMFFRTIGIEFKKNCLTIDDKKYCNSGNKKIRMFVNGKEIEEFEDYEFKSLDKILITYGNSTDSEISRQIKTVTNKAN